MRPVAARDLVGERLAASSVSGSVFGISNTAGDAAHHRGARAGFEVLLVLEPGLAEMHLRVDDAGQDVEAGAVDRLAGRAARDRSPIAAMRPPATPMSRARAAVVVDHGAALEEEVEALRHRGLLAAA